MRHTRTAARCLTVAAAGVLAATTTGVPAVAADDGATIETLSTGYVFPLGLASDDAGTIYVADGFTGRLLQTPGTGGAPTLVDSQPGFLAGVDATGAGTLTYVATVNQPTDTRVRRVKPDGSFRTLASPSLFERRVNPDRDVSYGFRGLAAWCARKLPPFVLPYQGIVDSNPYAVALGPRGRVYVADAAGNTVVRVGPRGGIALVAVLPPVDMVITPAARAYIKDAFDIDLPRCVVGKTYRAEPVPTDVEVGPNGKLYVSALPGAPELPGTGRVYEVDPATAAVRTVARGFTSAVDLALKGRTIYVAELFAGQISRTTIGGAKPVPVTAPGQVVPGAVEVDDAGRLLATSISFGPDGEPDGNSSVVVVTP
jgi:hypothetical protein